MYTEGLSIDFGPPLSTTNQSLVGPVQLLKSGPVDAAKGTIMIPLYLGHVKNGTNVWYILSDVDDADLEPKLIGALNVLATEGERIADGIGRTVVRNLRMMSRMGVYFQEEVQRRYPEFPTRKGEWNWQDYLPPLDAGLHRLIGMYS